MFLKSISKTEAPAILGLNSDSQYFEIGDMLWHNAESEKSIDYFKKSLTLDPTFEFSIQHLSWAYADMDMHDENIETCCFEYSAAKNGRRQVPRRCPRGSVPKFAPRRECLARLALPPISDRDFSGNHLGRADASGTP